MTSAATTASSSATLAELLRQRAGAKAIADHLDSLSVEARLAEVLAVTGKGVKHLYDAVADAEPCTLEEFFPAGEKGTRIYEGRNSLPLFSRFQKRFHRAPDGTIVGYNHQSMSMFTGPGYFTVKGPSGEGELGKELLFDYTTAPTFFPDGWPPFKPNDRGLSKAVYFNMKDYCRRVARGVVVGHAFKLGVDQKAYFSLTLPR